MFLLYDSATLSAIFLLIIFSVSVWNGGGFYIEVFGRKSVVFTCFNHVLYSSFVRFEREVEALRKELAEATARLSGSASPSSISRTNSEAGSTFASPNFISSDLPSEETLGDPNFDLDSSSSSSDSLESKKNS